MLGRVLQTTSDSFLNNNICFSLITVGGLDLPKKSLFFLNQVGVLFLF